MPEVRQRLCELAIDCEYDAAGYHFAVYQPFEDSAVLDTLFPIKTLSPAGMRLSTRLWTRVTSGT
ncbi:MULTISPECIES: hypothetical protein [unclassified Pseudomonas]|uniref:hypothetical protein n=1 Tax=unclassified Pseudomonas TaxID=196821 RepID=UPI0037F7B22C